jgi:hypothetical protein
VNNCIIGANKVLGILCRGTDYLLKKPKHHPIQPEPEEVIKKAEEVIKEQKCDKIYLATEDQYIYNLFKIYFGDLLLQNNQRKFERSDLDNVQYLAQIGFDREQDKYLTGLEYLSSIYLLSKCSCFIGGRTSGTIGVHLLSDGFEYDYTWNLGSYE